MSKSDDKAKEVSAEAATNHNEAGKSIIMFFIIGFVAFFIFGWIIFPKLLYSQKKQPIDFNHALHVGEVGDCESCHYFREDGSFSGAPKLAQCIDCHEEAMGEDPEEIKFVEEYVSQNKEVPWLIYSKQPPCVFFSHAAHVTIGEMECAECHGNIGESEHSRILQKNRLTGYSRDIWGENIGRMGKNPVASMKMMDCARCHKKEKVRLDSVQTQRGGCFVCHK